MAFEGALRSSIGSGYYWCCCFNLKGPSSGAVAYKFGLS